MRIEDIQFMEHLAVASPLQLREFCELVQRVLELPPFQYDAENMTEWGISTGTGIEYNVSRPYGEGTLKDWDPTVPDGANFGISIIFREGNGTPSPGSAALVAHVGRAVAAAVGAEVTHHRTWKGVGDNLTRNDIYLPEPGDA